MKDQHTQWEQIYSEEPDLYGVEPSLPSQRAADLFKKENLARILELGGGQGRDTLYFARRGFSVQTLDYKENFLGNFSRSRQGRYKAVGFFLTNIFITIMLNITHCSYLFRMVMVKG